jgi:hypothetical protein
MESWHGTVSIQTGYRLGDNKGVEVQVLVVKNFLFTKSFNQLLGPTQLPMDICSCFLGDKEMGGETFNNHFQLALR